jgi:uncharacterized membrane protein
MSTDPYKPPGSDLEDKTRENVDLAFQSPRNVGVMQGLQWYKEGFRYFAKSPGTWILITILFIVLLVLISLIPMPSQQFTLGNILDTFFLAGLMTGLYSLDKTGKFSVEYLFAAFKHPMRGQLLIVGLISFLMYGIVSYILLNDALVEFQQVTQQSTDGHPSQATIEETMQAAKTFYVAVFKTSLLTIPVMMLFWFTAPLIILHHVPAVAAMKLSFLGCFYNTPAFIVYILVGGLLAIFATLVLGLGWFVLLPVIVASQYAAWKDIFTPHKSSSA